MSEPAIPPFNAPLRPGEQVVWAAPAGRSAALDLFSAYSLPGWFLLLGVAGAALIPVSIGLRSWWLFLIAISPSLLALLLGYMIIRRPITPAWGMGDSEWVDQVFEDKVGIGPVEHFNQMIGRGRVRYAVTNQRVFEWLEGQPRSLREMVLRRVRQAAGTADAVVLTGGDRRKMTLRGVDDPAAVVRMIETARREL